MWHEDSVWQRREEAPPFLGGARWRSRRSATKRHGLPTVVQLRLTPAPGQAEALAAAVLLCNEAATVVSRLAWRHRVFAVVELQ
ncbi:hypothetical protein [Nonomuraea sp. NPDC049141]|uniref:hypothetical protein n=1 Tax=Nonomuraea sp. NPDC049141 TaxID=3155500 RepID=UPI003411941B